MARIINQNEVGSQHGSLQYWTYNALDVCVTREVFDVLRPRLDAVTGPTYAFERAVQAPAMTMALRGVRIDDQARSEAVRLLTADKKAAVGRMAAIIAPVWEHKAKAHGVCPKAPVEGGRHKWPRQAKDAPPLDEATMVCGHCGGPRLVAADFNPLSSQQVIALLYGKLMMQKQFNRKTRAVSADDECVGRLIAKYPGHVPLLRGILDARGVQKQIGFLNSKTGADGRMHSSFNVGATETFRWSASKNAYMEGCNIQQIADRTRFVFIADPGMDMFYADLEQAESRCVAYDAEDENYIKAHDAGDVHTAVSKLLWPELDWNGDLVHDRRIAEQHAPWDPDPSHDYRLYAKKVQHGSNIGMTPHGIAREAHITVAQAADVQKRYFSAFPRVRAHQLELGAQVRATGQITTPMGDKRQFFGRLWDDSTIREALAFTQQAMIARILNMGLWRVWHEMDLQGGVPDPRQPNRAWVLAQVHDAVLGLVRSGDHAALRRVKELMTIAVPVRGRTMIVPVEILVGQNFRKYNPKDPTTKGGLVKWRG